MYLEILNSSWLEKKYFFLRFQNINWSEKEYVFRDFNLKWLENVKSL